ncbi:MAG: RNA repair domain-containing protein [Methanothrix sp.]|nr:RNA repair domain-containing protein [Methanothrix sp.]MDD3710735.1 RNA repair domain-containing protein [Methanothrix sp.]MDD5768628.1 RNA repair domain-containing protein [Methanothrix sp.]MDI9398697.1 RNA repair domain-containing protein [Euryarchaeota archaeon]
MNEIKWRGLDMDKCEIEVLHRGAPRNRIIIRGSDISLGRSFFTFGETMIPYHRILRVRYDGRTVFSRAEI